LGTAYGNDLTFTTISTAPEAVTLPATEITTASARLNGSINSNKQLTTVSFEYGKSSAYGQTAPVDQGIHAGDSVSLVSSDISGLASGSTYHFRIKAVYPTGTAYGNDSSFTTKNQMPDAITLPATEVLTTSATLNGTVNAYQQPTTVTFEYG
jgi:hypothetical protein